MSALLNKVPLRYEGAIILVDGTDRPPLHHNGIPYEIFASYTVNFLAVEVNGTVSHIHQGIPFTANGRLAMSFALVDRTEPGTNPFDADGRLVFSAETPVATVHGVNYVESNAIYGSTTGPPPPPPLTIVATPDFPVFVGEEVTFTVSPFGDPFTQYQWFANNVPITGETGETYVRVIQAGDDGVQVRCVGVQADSQYSISNTITVDVLQALECFITPSPTVTIYETESVAFSASGQGGTGAYAYQWNENGVPVAGAINQTYNPTYALVNDGVSVTCTISELGRSATSTPTVVTVLADLTVSIAPTAPEVIQGQPIAFTSTVAGGDASYTYQWKLDGAPISGAVNANYTRTTVAGDDGKTITLDVTSAGRTVTSNVATMSVLPALTVTITSVPDPASGYEGDTIEFTAVASGADGTYTYQWRADGVNIVGETTPAYTRTLGATDNGVAIDCFVTSFGVSADSNDIPLVLVGPLAVTIAPVNPQEYEGDVTTFTCTPTGGDGSYVYEWREGGVAIPGETAATYARTIAAGDDGVVITCAVTSFGQTVVSNTSTITVLPAFSVAISPASVTDYSGESVTYTATPTGGDGTYEYAWAAQGVQIPNETAATYTRTLLPTDDGIPIQVASLSAGLVVISDTSFITILPDLSVTIADAPAYPVLVGTSVTLTATPVGGNASYTYSWKADGAPIDPPETGATLVRANGTATAGVALSCDVTSAGKTVSSNVINQIVYDAPTVTIAADVAEVIEGGVVTFTATPAGGDGNYTYVWKADGAPIANETTATYARTTVLADDGVSITCEVTSFGTTVASNAIALVVWPVVSGTVVSAPPYPVIINTETVLTVTPAGGDSTYTYQWQLSSDTGGTWSPISGQTGVTLTNQNPEVRTTRQYRCQVTSVGVTVNTAGIDGSVYAAVTATIAPTSGAGYAGAVIAFTCTPGGGDGNYAYQWNINGAPVSGQTAATYNHTLATNGEVITCSVTSYGSTAVSAGATMTVWAAPTVSIAPTSLTAVEGTVQTFTATPAGGSGTYAYQWYKGGVAVSGQTAATYAYTAALADNGLTIFCHVNSSGAAVNSNEAPLSISAAFTAPTYIDSSIGTANSPLWDGNYTESGAIPANAAGDVFIYVLYYNAPTYQGVNPPAGFVKLAEGHFSSTYGCGMTIFASVLGAPITSLTFSNPSYPTATYKTIKAVYRPAAAGITFSSTPVTAGTAGVKVTPPPFTTPGGQPGFFIATACEASYNTDPAAVLTMSDGTMRQSVAETSYLIITGLGDLTASGVPSVTPAQWGGGVNSASFFPIAATIGLYYP